MAADDTNLLTKVNLNGTELVIADMDARQKLVEGGAALDETNKALAETNNSIDEALDVVSNRLTALENEPSVITAKYDAQSQTLSLTSKS